MILVVFHNPERYLQSMMHEKSQLRQLSEQQLVLSKKIVKGTLRISPLFRSSRKCLIESLIVYQVLRKYQIPAKFQVGAKRSNDKITTHAWIEIGDQVIIGGPVEDYQKLIRTR